MKLRYAMPFVVMLLSLAVLFTACQIKEVTSAKVYIQQDNWEKATEQLEKAVEQYPENAEARYLLGHAYAKDNQWKKMVEQFDAADSLSDEYDQDIQVVRDQSWVQLFNTAVTKLNDNKVDSAITMFETAALINPERPETYRTLGISYSRQEDYEKAKDAFKRYIETQPDSVDGYIALARTHLGLEEFEPVVGLMKKALELDPDNKDAIVNLGLAYDLLGETEKAKETYEKALEKNPGDQDILFNLGRLYLVNDEMDKALDLFNNLLEQNPKDYEANISVGQALLQIAQDYQKELVKKEDEGKEVTEEEVKQLRTLYGKAIPYLEKAVEIAESDDDITLDSSLLYNLGIVYGQTGEREKAEEAFERSEELEN
ncbi:MAG: tetratricopeptide repeat protein [candidate division KSB1 bacterium]|nr:tetratricopeptide repeat protein [candidate division KSB1 bacterium]